MQNGCPPWFIEKQTSDPAVDEGRDACRSPASPAKLTEFPNEAPANIIFDAFTNVIERLERLLDMETAMLIEHRPIALDDFNHRKRHGLLELSRVIDALRGLEPDYLSDCAKAPLARLRLKLQRNLSMLRMHLDAVGALAAIIARAIQEHESDGTYTLELGNKGESG